VEFGTWLVSGFKLYPKEKTESVLNHQTETKILF